MNIVFNFLLFFMSLCSIAFAQPPGKQNFF